MIILLKLTCLILGLQTMAFGVSVWKEKNSVADVFWGLNIALGAFFVVLPLALFFVKTNPILLLFSPTVIMAVLIILWGLRLTYHLGKRFLKHKNEDPRYAAMSQNWQSYYLRSYLQVFLLQGGLMLLMLSSLVVTTLKSQIPNFYFMSAGVALFMIGFLIEIIADKQLVNFIKQAEKPALMRRGLWKYSRHPNYFGEVVLWWGIWLITLPTPYWYLTLITPVTITVLILKISGVPLAEKQLQAKEGFADYAAKTNKFFLWKPNS